MTNRDRVRVIFHGGVVLLVGLLCGYPAVAEAVAGDESMRPSNTAHQGLMMVGILRFAVASVLPSLALGGARRRVSSGRCWRRRTA